VGLSLRKLGDTLNPFDNNSKLSQVVGGLVHGTEQTGAAGVRSLYDIGRGAAASVTGNQQALINANQAKAVDNPQFLAPFTRPIIQGVRTIEHPFTDNSFTPTSPDAQRVFGAVPVQNVAAGVRSNYQATHNPLEAGLYGVGQVAQDVAAFTGAKAGLEGAARPVVRALDNRVPLNEVGAIGKGVNEPRPNNALQSQIEAAHNMGNKALEAKLVAQLPDPAMNPNYTMPVDQKAALIAKMNKPIVTAKGKPFDTQEYIDQQVKAQKDAAKGNVPGKVTAIKNNIRQKFVDSLVPIEDPVIAAKGREGALPLRNQLDRALRADTIAGRYAQDNGLAKVVQNVPDTKAFDQYLIAKHAQDLEKNGVKTGRDLGKDQQLIDALGPEYEQHAQALQKYNHGLLDTATNYGLISKDTADHLKQKYPNYVPFDRVFSDAEQKLQKGNGAGVASLSTQSVVQRIKGSGRQIQPPLESILSKTKDVVDQGERNLAAKQLIETGGTLPDNPFGLRELKPNETIGTRPTVSYLENGQKRTFETTPEIAAAAKSLNKEQLGFLGQVFAVPTRILRLGATSLNPAFALANVAKDTVSAFINSEHSLRASPANPKVFMMALKAAGNHSSDAYKELVSQGAGGTSFDIARNAAPMTVKRLRASKNLATHGVYVVTHPGELIRAAENTIGRSEEFNRAIQYFGNKDAALAKGATESNARVYAADAARNNTVNFSRAGDYGRVLNTVLPYLNAGFQGSRTLLRNLKDRPVQTGAKLAIAGFMPVAATTAWNLSDPNRKRAYDSISDYEKQNNIIIIGPNAHQDAQGRWTGVIKIPTSQEIANLNNVVRNGVEDLHGDKSFDFKAMVGDLIGTATSLNAQNPRQAVGQITPQAVKPFAETALNQNLFTGQQIVPDAQKNLNSEDQFNKGTSGTARVIGKVTGTSPLQIDNAIRTTTGGLGQNIVNATDTALNKVGVIPKSEVQGQGLFDSIANRFVSAQGQTPGAQYFSTLQKTAHDQNLAGADYDQLNSITSKSLTTDGTPKPLNEQDSLEKSRILAASPNISRVISDTAVALAKKQGKAVDPLYNLTPEQQHAYYQIQASPYKGDDYNRLVADAQSWLPALQNARSVYYQNNPIPVGGSASDKVKYPSFDSTTTNLLDQAGSLTGAERAQFIQANPKLQTAYDQISKYTNDKRIAQGYDPFKAYPTATPDVQKAIDTYNALPKGNGSKGGSPDRAAWIAAHPDTYAQMQDYYAQSASWELANNAGSAKYAGADLNQKALKAAYGLGQYDIVKNPDGTYAINPSAVYAANSGSGGGKSYTSRTAAELQNPYYNAIDIGAGGKPSIGKAQKPKVSKTTGGGYRVKAKGYQPKVASRPKVSRKKAVA
jgi:hypothetical protein